MEYKKKEWQQEECVLGKYALQSGDDVRGEICLGLKA